jgi:hypothetical protein
LHSGALVITFGGITVAVLEGRGRVSQETEHGNDCKDRLRNTANFVYFNIFINDEHLQCDK